MINDMQKMDRLDRIERDVKRLLDAVFNSLSAEDSAARDELEDIPVYEQFLRLWEGFKLAAYDDGGGQLTIGVGHAITHEERRSGKIQIDGDRVLYRKGLTFDQAYALLRQDVAPCFDAVDKLEWSKSLNENQRAAVVSFMYNCGINAFLKSTLCKEMWRRYDFSFLKGLKAPFALDGVPYSDGELPLWATSIAYQWRRWRYDNGRVVTGLERRRHAELLLFFDGVVTGP